VTAGRRVVILVENESVPFDRRVWDEGRVLVEAGYRVMVVCPRGTDRDTEPYAELEGIQIYRFPLRFADSGPGYVLEYGLAMWHSLAMLLRLHRRERLTVVHMCNPPDLMVLAVLPLKLLGARLVYDQHDVVPEFYMSRFPEGPRLVYWALRLLERLTFAAADAVIATNQSYRAIALTRGRVPPERVFVVRNGPDLDRFTPVAADPSLKRGKRYLACYVGVMGHHDGVDYALRALAHLRHDLGRIDVHAAFVGSGDAHASCVALARELGLDDCVEFTGRVPNELLQRYLSTADVCLSPDPRSAFNDMSTMTKVMEYMAMSCPIVSFDLTESRFSAGEAAVYASDNDEREFGGLVDELLNDPDRRAAMGAAGRGRVERSLSWNSSKQPLLDAYYHALAGRSQAQARSGLRRLTAVIRLQANGRRDRRP
jgi:glycosyltransferase involved in cell wall biosynthesis